MSAVMKVRKNNSAKRKRIKAILSALPSALALARGVSKEKPQRIRRVTIETERTLIFRNRSGVQQGWCVECGDQVQMASVDAAAHDTGLSELAIYQLVESGALHFTEDENRRVRVCLNSLPR